jgi:surfeit locus 1 family protein
VILLKTIFSKRNILPTLLVVVASIVMVRLGFWQLDRLAQRRVFNARVLAWIDAEPLTLNADALGGEDLPNMEYRLVEVRGSYDYDQQIALRLQQFESQAGIHLITPLHIEGTNVFVLVDRGWIPLGKADQVGWSAFDEDDKVVTITARMRRAGEGPDFGSLVDPTLSPDQDRLLLWYSIDPRRVAAQSGLPILENVYLQQLPEDTDQTLPFAQAPAVEISEGPHLGYAFQWFAFAAILLTGYPIYLLRRADAVPDTIEDAKSK